MPRRVQIPAVNDKLVLAKQWTFRLFNDHKNATLADHLGLVPEEAALPEKLRLSRMRYPLGSNHAFNLRVSLGPGTELHVTRMGIRSGGYGKDTIGFMMKPSGARRRLRFWALLEDVNTMVVRSTEWDERELATEASAAAATRKPGQRAITLT